MSFEAIDGGLHLPEQPDWALQFSAAEESTAAAQYWSKIVTAMRAADTVGPANGHAIERLVIFQIVYDWRHSAG